MRSHTDCIMAWMTEPRERVLAADARALTTAEVAVLNAPKVAPPVKAKQDGSPPGLPKWAVDHIALRMSSSRLGDWAPSRKISHGISKNIVAVNQSFSLSDEMRKLDYDAAMDFEIREYTEKQKLAWKALNESALFR